jgi:cell division protein FtsW
MKKLAVTIFLDSFALIMLGLIIVMSASSTFSEFKFDSVFHLFNSHLFKVLLGGGFLALFCFIPYELYKDYSKPAIFIIAFVLFITLFLAPNIKGAGRWINVGFISFQPADAAKLILILHLAALLDDKKEVLHDFRNGFIYLFFWVLLIAGLVLIQPNISNGVLIVIIGLTLIYIGGAKLKHIFVSAMFCVFSGLTAAMIFPHSRGRILSYVNNIQNGGDLNIQVKQALLGLGSGGIFGVGIGHSRQNNLFLPEAYGDFIFAILGEELGFIGVVIVLIAFLIFFGAGLLIAKKTKDRFGQLLAFGISFSVIIYAFINVGVTSGLLPTTGLPLPFISYGGTSLVFLCISTGILINIAITNEMRERNLSVQEPQNVQEINETGK